MSDCCKKSLMDKLCRSVFPLVIAGVVGASIGAALVKREQDRCCNKASSNVSCCSKCACLKCEQAGK
jgi:hypothetical protein